MWAKTKSQCKNLAGGFRSQNISGNAVREDERRGGGSSDRNRGSKGLFFHVCGFVTIVLHIFVFVFLWQNFCGFVRILLLILFLQYCGSVTKLCLRCQRFNFCGFVTKLFLSHHLTAILFRPIQEAGQTNNLNLLLISQLYKPYFSGKTFFQEHDSINDCHISSFHTGWLKIHPVSRLNVLQK